MPLTHTSRTRQAISEISATACRPILGRLGFRRAAPHFWRVINGLSQCVNFQASAWGSREAGSFTINLGISSPALLEGFTGQRFPKLPASALWPVNTRIGFVMPERRDLWWDVDENTDLASVGGQVATAVSDYAVPWFEKLATRKDLIDAVEDRPRALGIFPAQVPLVLAIFAAEDGDLARARLILASALEDSRGKAFESAVRQVADRLSIALEDR